MEKFDFIKTLGSGSYGKVYLAETKNQAKVQRVIKEIAISNFKSSDFFEAKKEVDVSKLFIYYFPTIII